MATYAPNQLHSVPLAELQPDPTQPRKYLDPLARIIGKSPATISEALSLNKLPQAIRDECRQDPTVPKKMLVTIARNKQQRSMVTQFQLYRKQQAQAGVMKTPGAKRTKAEALAGASNPGNNWVLK